LIVSTRASALEPRAAGHLHQAFLPAVVVSARRLDGHLVLRVEDDGVGLAPGWSMEEDSGIGLRLTRERLAVRYPDSSSRVEAIGPEAMPLTVFVTAFAQHAVRAFEANALDYILKPFSDERMQAMLSRAKQRLWQIRDHRHEQ